MERADGMVLCGCFCCNKSLSLVLILCCKGPVNLYTLLFFSVCLFLSLSLLCDRCLQAPALPVKRIPAPIRVCVCSSGRASVATAAWHHLEGRSAMTVSLSPLLLFNCCRKTQCTGPQSPKLVCQWMRELVLLLLMGFLKHQPV